MFTIHAWGMTLKLGREGNSESVDQIIAWLIVFIVLTENKFAQ